MADVEDKKDAKERGEKMAKELKRYAKLTVLVGFQGASALESKDESDATVVDVATFNEFGTDTVPERPFLRSALDMGKDEIGQAIEDGTLAIMDGKKNAVQAASLIGIVAQKLVQKRIVELSDPPNSTLTILMKGSSNPLVDTGQMVQAVTWTVREGNAIKAAG
jgi:hypothetical protein